MRLDLYLKVSRLVKRRTLARGLCDEGRVLLNHREARPAKEVKPGDVVTLLFSTRRIELEVLGTPVSMKKADPSPYRIISEERLPREKDE